MKNLKIAVLMALCLPAFLSAQTLEQQLRQAIEAGVLPPNAQNPVGPFSGMAPGASSRDNAPFGIGSAVTVPAFIEEVKMGSLSTFFPKGYGKEPLHFGIWNAIPFVVFNNENMELRFGLIFENRQVGFVPDDWVNTTITGPGKPEISFLIPKAKTFLNFARGTSQWRSTVLLTDNQIKDLEEYTQASASSDPQEQIFTVTHRFVDSSTRLYLIGERHREFFQAMLRLYNDMSRNKNVKTFQKSNVFPRNGFFDDLTLQNVTEENISVTTTVTEEEAGGYNAQEGYADGYGGEAGYDEAGGYEGEAGYDEAGGYEGEAGYDEAGYEEYGDGY